MSQTSFDTVDELADRIGSSLRDIRLSKGLKQTTLADKAGVSPRALRALEAGEGSSLGTFLSVVKALGAVDIIDVLSTKAQISPMAMLTSGRYQRSRGSR